MKAAKKMASREVAMENTLSVSGRVEGKEEEGREGGFFGFTC
jgi:hypothetical protein